MSTPAEVNRAAFAALFEAIQPCTQSELARVLGVSRSWVSMLRSRGVGKLETLGRMIATWNDARPDQAVQLLVVYPLGTVPPVVQRVNHPGGE